MLPLQRGTWSYHKKTILRVTICVLDRFVVSTGLAVRRRC
jgi:hypothetical protein